MQKKINVELDNYIIVYAYPGRLSKKEEKYIKNFANFLLQGLEI